MRDTGRLEQRCAESGISTLQSMLVLAILAVLVLVGLPSWRTFTERSKVQSCQSNQRSIVKAIETAQADRVLRLPVGYYDDVLEVGTDWGQALIPNYLSKTPRCPVTGQTYYMSPLGKIWSDMGSRQYFFLNQGRANDHRLAVQ